MNRYILKVLLSITSILSLANYVCVSVKPGDTFNAILKQQKISAKSIDQINASLAHTPVLSRLSPDDEIAIYAPKDNILVSAYIKQRKQHYIINKDKHTFKATPITVEDGVSIISLSSEQEPENQDQLIAKRAAAMLFPKQSGLIHAAFKGKKLISMKLSTPDDTVYAFLHDDTKFPVYTDANGHVITPALSRTPTDYLWISSHFNPHRLHPISKKVRPHNGVDLAALINTPIWAAADGKVVHRSSDSGFGNFLIIEHTNGIKTCYAHLNKFHNNIQVGQTVRAFETIGYVGSTGISEGNHLHFEIRLNDKPQDPLTVTLQQGDKVSSIAPHYYF